MFAFMGFCLFIISLMVHEIGHAVAMHRRNVDIKELGIGFPLGKIRLTLHPSFVPFPIVLGPLLFGAYVSPSSRGTEQLEMMRFKDKAVCYGAGVVVNLVFASGLLVVAGLTRFAQPDLDATRSLWVIGVAGGIGAVSYLFRRPISMISPLLGVAFAALVVWFIMSAPNEDNLGGPIEVISLSFSAGSLFEALLLGAVISLSLGTFNMIPMVPLDGGRVLSAAFVARGWERLNSVYSVVTGLSFGVFFIYLIVTDILSL